MMTDVPTLDTLAAVFGPAESLPAVAALAVSGGSDSMALLYAGHRAFAAANTAPIALTVDHGLRPESAREAATVARTCAVLGIEHHILHWQFEGAGNLSAAAREGRYGLMAQFCARRGIAHLYTGHTRDDQAETVLMRLARGSGVDGLAGMADEAALWGLTLRRPFLSTWSRADLRAVLAGIGQSWAEDPTNDDPSYDRVKARAILDRLEPLGLTRDRLVDTAAAMGRAKAVLDAEAVRLKAGAVTLDPLGYARFDVAAFNAAQADTRYRAFADLLRQVSGNAYRPDFDALCAAFNRVALGPDRAAATLHGCLLRRVGAIVCVLREPAACARATQSGKIEAVWDSRFAVEGDGLNPGNGLSLRMVGEDGLLQIKRDNATVSEVWQSTPREARLTTPGLWHGERLLSAPLAPWHQTPQTPTLRARIVWPGTC